MPYGQSVKLRIFFLSAPSKVYVLLEMIKLIAGEVYQLSTTHIHFRKAIYVFFEQLIKMIVCGNPWFIKFPRSFHLGLRFTLWLWRWVDRLKPGTMIVDLTRTDLSRMGASGRLLS
jgi:hypothetical protein